MPLFNIFKNKRQTQNNSFAKIKPKIIADIHEKDSLIIPELIELGAEVEIKPLEVSDYIINNIAIERKTIADFASSMISKRLIQQLENMLQYEKRILIIEGKIEDARINPKAIIGMMLSIELDKKIPIIQTKNTQDTANYLFILAKQQLKGVQESTLHSRKPKSKQEQVQYIIESFPDIGPKNAKILIQKFKTIKDIINASPEELEAEIGKKADSIINLRD